MRTHYSVEFKLQVLAALDENDGNLYKTAQQFGIPRVNVSDWNRQREKIYTQGETLLQQRRLRLSQRMELIINQIVDRMPKKVDKARLSESAQALRILLDLRAAVEAQQRQEKVDKTAAYEKLALLIERRAAAMVAGDTETFVPIETLIARQKDYEP